MNNPIIFGAGLAGLIAARIMADRSPRVLEVQPSLPNNHKALMRFRSDIVSRATNVPFRKVTVLKSIQGYGDPIKDALAYSLKVTGKLQARSILDTSTVERYIAPDDFIGRLASTADIEFNQDFLEWSHNLQRPHGPIISTIPMPAMMDMFKWQDRPQFITNQGWTLKATIAPELESTLSCTVYDPRKSVAWYRASITGDDIMFEGTGSSPFDDYDEGDLLEIAQCYAKQAFRLDKDAVVSASVHSSKYQKLGDMNGRDRERCKRFIMYLSSEHNIYSLGRFATWRPKLLLDDIVKDVEQICRLIDGETLYNSKL